MAIDYNTVKSELNSAGEILIVTDAGQSFEIHLDDIEFDDESECFRWDNGDERYVLSGDSVESIQVHGSHKMN